MTWKRKKKQSLMTGNFKSYFTANKEESSGKNEEKKRIMVSVQELFKFADGVDILLIVLGLVCAAISGACVPAETLLFGQVTNGFVYHNVNITHFQAILANELNVSIDALPFLNVSQYPKPVQDHIASSTSFIHELQNNDMMSKVQIFGYGSIILGFINMVMSYIFVASLNAASTRQIFRIRNLFFLSILRQDISYYDTTETGDFASRCAEDLKKLEDGIGEKMGMFVAFISTCLLSLINAFAHGWKLSLVILSLSPILMVASGIMTKVQGDMVEKEITAYAKAGSIAEEVISAIRTVYAFGGQKKEVDRYNKNLIYARKAARKRGLVHAAGSGSMWLVIYAGYALAFWYGTRLIISSRPPQCDTNCGEYDAGTLVLVFFSVMMGAINIGHSSTYFEAFTTSRVAATTIYSTIVRIPPIDSLSSEGDKPSNVNGMIVLRKVGFSYPSRSEATVLQDLNLVVKRGETVALVGSSGCGKSTILQLIQRFYDPSAGQVLLDGHDLVKLNVGWLREQIGFVGQEPVLFAMSIRENICHGKIDATFEEVQVAAKRANAHDFIMKLPQEYDTLVGERGTQLSGGQKQRIAIARALLRDPKILLLDEATSALDTKSETVVQEALEKASEGRTTILIAHRLSTVRSANRICVIDNGQLCEEGTHDELMERGQTYYKLVMAQTKHTVDLNEGANENGDESNGVTAEHDKLANISETPGSPPMHRRSSLRRHSATKESENEEAALEKVSLLKMMKLSLPEWPYLLFGSVGAAVMGFTIPFYAMLFGELLGNLAEADQDVAEAHVNFFSCVFLVWGVIAGLFEFLKVAMFSLAGDKLTTRTRKQVFESLLQQEIGWFDDKSNNTGALCSRLSEDAANLQGATGYRVGIVVQSITTLLLGVALALYYDYRLGLSVFVFVPILLFSTYYSAMIITGQTVMDNEALEDASKLATEAISHIRTVSSLHLQRHFHQTYVDTLTPAHKKSLWSLHPRSIAFGMAQSIFFFAYATCMLYGGYLVSKNEVYFTSLFKVAEALILGASMVGNISAFVPNYNKGVISTRRVFTLLERKPQIETDCYQQLYKLKNPIGEVALKNVEFRYPTRPTVKVLRKINIEVKPSQTIALVGSSGCGKSTVIQLLQRFYDANAGQVCFDDNSYKTFNLGWLRQQFGIVSQEPVLFDISIAENIAYGDNQREVSMQEIIEAAKLANIHNFIANLPEGYNTLAGDRGAQLSGGQKQRVAIARALIRNPKVLLLDEATSALDSENEKVVNEALEGAQSGRTCIVIAHRLSTIQNADRILVVQGGTVVEQGRHADLMATKGVYYNLHSTN